MTEGVAVGFEIGVAELIFAARGDVALQLLARFLLARDAIDRFNMPVAEAGGRT